MNKWEELATTATLENFLKELLHKLKKFVFDYRIDNKVLIKEVFQEEIERHAKVSRTNILTKLFKNKEDYHKEANAEFTQMV